MTDSNLSKIKTKFRTSGRISGNFGKSKVKIGSQLNEIGMSNAKVIKCPTQTDYLRRLYDAYDKTTDPKLKDFIYKEIRKIHVQRGVW